MGADYGELGRGGGFNGVGLRALACWNCGLESRCVYGSLSLVKCCGLSDRSLCDGPTTRPEESYRV